MPASRSTQINYSGGAWAPVSADPWHAEIVSAVNNHAAALDAGGLVPPPYVDLRATPYFIVANNSSAAAANTTGINAAIAAFSGTNARLVLPSGLIYVDRVPTKLYSIFFGDGVNKLTLSGQGMFATTIIQQGDSNSALWDAIICDGSSKIELCNFGVQQGTITNPSPIQQNSLISVYANVVNVPSADTTDTSIHHIYFGQCIGDQLRFCGSANSGEKLVNTVKAQHLIMRGQGIGQGARSGMAFQRGLKNIECSDFYIEGQKNSPIDMEPSGTNPISNVHIHHGTVNNALGVTFNAVSLGGVDGTQAVKCQFDHVLVNEGFVEVLGGDNWDISDVQIYASGSGPCAPGSATDQPCLFLFHQTTNTRLYNINIIRDTGAATGPLITISGVSTNIPSRLSLEGGQWLTKVGAGSNLCYIDMKFADKCQFRGVHLRVEDPSPTTSAGWKLQTTGGDITQTQFLGCKIESPNGKLAQGIYFSASNSHAISGILVSDLFAAGAVTTGVQFDLNGGTSFEVNPVVQGCDFTGATNAWVAINSAAGAVFPVIGGSKGGVCSLTGTVAPGSVVTALAGSNYVKTTGEVYISSGGTTWTQLTVP